MIRKMFRKWRCTGSCTLLRFRRFDPLERRVVISSTIFIGNLSFDSTEDELRAVLVEIDPNARVRLGKDKITGKTRGFAFAEFSSPTAAADAIRRLDGYDLRGRRLRVNDADDKPPPRAPRPGPAAPMTSMPPPGMFDMDRFGAGGGDGPPGGGRRGSGKSRRGGKRTLW